MLLKKRIMFTTKLTARTLNSSLLWLQLLIIIVYTNLIDIKKKVSTSAVCQ